MKNVIKRGVNYQRGWVIILAFIDLLCARNCTNNISFIQRKLYEMNYHHHFIENGDLEKNEYLLQDYTISKWGNSNLSTKYAKYFKFQGH